MKARWLSLVVLGLAVSVWSAPALAQGVIPPEGQHFGAGNTGAATPPSGWALPTSSPTTAPLALQPAPAMVAPGQSLPVQPQYTGTAGTACFPQAAAPCVPPARPFTPFMLGDFVGPVANQFSDVKIAEGESPAPVDRVFLKFNYYNNLDKSRWRDPTEPIHNVDLYRYSLGFEKTFFDQRFSFGLRVPFYTLDAAGKSFRLLPVLGTEGIPVPGSPGFDVTEFGNVSAVAKLVLWENRPTGSLISAGATVSLPTASAKLINPGSSTLTYVQPFAGFIVNRGDLFFQGFTSVTAPIASAESIVFFADVGAGYYLYRNPNGGLLTGFAPTLELHLADPLRQADPKVLDFGIFDNAKLHNVVDCTLGGTFEFANRATLGVGFVVPFTGPKPFDVEALAQLNDRF